MLPGKTRAKWEREAARSRAISSAVREIGSPPLPENPQRRLECSRDFRRFCETYLPAAFALAWSDAHLEVIARIEDVTLRGGRFAIATPRGSGKTSLCEAACLWALLYGHREFVVLIGANEEHAGTMLASIKSELECNNLLHADFPDVCHAVAALEGVKQRAAAQICEGQPTHLTWTQHAVTFPVLPLPGLFPPEFRRQDGRSAAAGNVLRVAGLMGQVRGLRHKTPDGRVIRPSLVFVDDPQTDESARSPTQCNQREQVLTSAVANLAGPGVEISILVAGTIIARDDLMHRLTDRESRPEWRGMRVSAVRRMPERLDLWRRYGELLAEDHREQDGRMRALAFYQSHRAEMDRGAEVFWDALKLPGEVSALQHFMNVYLTDERAFWSEYQNDPQLEEPEEHIPILADDLLRHLSNIPRGQVPAEVEMLTAAIDIQAKCLYWLVAGFAADGTIYIPDYGIWPQQEPGVWALQDVRRTLAAVYGGTFESSIYEGLRDLVSMLATKDYAKTSGPVLRVSRIHIDAGWHQTTDIVFRVCRESEHGGICWPARGKFIPASSTPMSEWRRRPGERVGLNWRIMSRITRGRPWVLYDVNWWKSWLAARLTTPRGSPGTVLLWGKTGSRHAGLVEHLTAEYAKRVESSGRAIDEWRLRPGRRDDHWKDCLVSACVAASISGMPLAGQQTGQGKARAKPAAREPRVIRPARVIRPKTRATQ